LDQWFQALSTVFGRRGDTKDPKVRVRERRRGQVVGREVCRAVMVHKLSMNETIVTDDAYAVDNVLPLRIIPPLHVISRR